ncbi:MAG TPA: hypothetical protein VML96_13710 [Egibacteraceae bacterium]|nr:hypothetical protein [Egibacteraceae bacterium]
MDLTHRLARIRLGRRAVRDPSRMAVAAAGAAAVLVCAAAGGVVWLSLGQLGDEVEARDLDTAAALANALGRLPGDERAAALPAPSPPSPRRAFALIAEDGSASPPDLGTSQDGARWQRWAARVVREAGLAQQFTSRDPSGAEWRYVTASMPDGSTVLLGRPGGLQPAVIGDALRAVLAVLLGVGLLGAIAWPLVRQGSR